MPFSYYWPLTAPPAPVPATPPVLPVFPAPGEVEYCNGTMHDEEYFLGVIDQSFPQSYIGPMQQNTNSGYEIFAAESAVAARVSLAIERLECGSFIMFAPLGATATVQLELQRPNSTAGIVTVKAGTVFSTSSGGLQFCLTGDVTFGSGVVGPLVCNAVAVAQGYEWNVPGEFMTAAGISIPGAIDTIDLLYTDPPYGDITFFVRQPLAATGGCAPMLEGLGADRGVVRLPNEPGDAYRLRVQQLPDTVSPGAIRRAVAAQLDPYALHWFFRETFDIRYQTCWDAPSPNSGTPSYQAVAPTNPNYDSNLFCYDDTVPPLLPPASETRLPKPWDNVWLNDQILRGAFVVGVQAATLFDVGFAYDDPGMQPSDFKNTANGRQRGTPAYDVPWFAPASVLDTALVYVAAYDGYDTAYAALTLGLWNLLQRIKAAGVAVILQRFYE